MRLFHFPQTRHTRSQRPRQFKHYRSYKPYLQREFERVCVYCRQPDSSAPNLSFGVDHYRPKSIPRFAPLLTDYCNLYYCCGACNSRKQAYWPEDEATGPHVVNPCDHTMTDHLRFAHKTAEVEHRTLHGQFTVELLELNAPERVQYRVNALTLLEVLDHKLAELEREGKELAADLRANRLDQAAFNSLMQDLKAERSRYEDARASVIGATALPPLPGSRLGVNLTAPPASRR